MKIVESSKCYGCGACKSVCPVQAVEIVQDKKGFFKYAIQQDACIQCGACVNVCPRISDVPILNENKKVLGVKHMDVDERMKSQSGGAFYALAEAMIAMGGVVIGVVQDKNHMPYHDVATTLEEVQAMRKSKYIQSRVDHIYPVIDAYLNQEKPVLFSGTACQVAGVASYFKKHKNEAYLYLLDIICHGVPSQKLLSDTLVYYEKKYEDTLIHFTYRNKDRGWHKGHQETLYFKDKVVQEKILSTLFYKHVAFNDACQTCQFNQFNRVGDLTIGDFWGIEKVDFDFDDNKGVSVVLVNSKKGDTLVDKSNSNIFIREFSQQDCSQRPLRENYKKSKLAPLFWWVYLHFGMEKVEHYFVEKNGLANMYDGLRKIKEYFTNV